MSQPSQPRAADAASARTPEHRALDHGAIGRLADELLPALVAKLAATGLGEIEVREGPWKVRLRRTAGAGAGPARRVSDRPSRPQPGHEGHGHAPGALEGHRSARGGAAVMHSTNGSSAGSSAGDHDTWRDGPDQHGVDPHRAVATSPAVGVFQPRAETGPGARVRAGDRIGIVNMLGIPQDVIAPADGIVAGILVEPGDAVEYGQELIALELMTHTGGGGG